jgi:hypothetical protein
MNASILLTIDPSVREVVAINKGAGSTDTSTSQKQTQKNNSAPTHKPLCIEQHILRWLVKYSLKLACPQLQILQQ